MRETDNPTAPSPTAPARGPVRRACKAALDYLSGAMVKMIPVLLVCGMFKTAQTLIGSSMLGLVGETDNLYALLGMATTPGSTSCPSTWDTRAPRSSAARPSWGLWSAAS